MRMSVGTRVLLSIFLVVIICALVFVLCTMFGLLPSTMLEGVFATAIRGGFWYKLLYAVILVAFIVIALILLFFRSPRERNDHQRTITISDLEGGKIVMTTKAVEELVQREVQATSGVRSSSSKVLSSGDYIDVLVNMAIRHGENIPDVTKSLHDKLESELTEQVGVTPRDINITVTDVSDTTTEPNTKSGQKAPRVV